MTSSPVQDRVARIIARMNVGGPAHQVALLSGRRLAQRGFQTLLVTGQVGPGEASMEDLATRHGAPLRRARYLSPEIRPGWDALALAELARALRTFRPAIVHTHTAKAGVLGRLAATTVHPRPALVHTYHGHVLSGYFSPRAARGILAAERRLARISDCLIGVSQATVDDLVQLGVAPEERFRVIPLGLELDEFKRVDKQAGGGFRRRLGIPADTTVLTYVGRFAPIKRLDVLVAALARCVRAGARVQLVLAGDGPTRPDIEARVERLKLQQNVSFLGYSRDVPAIAAATDIAVLSSDNEGTPVWLIEAAAAAIPAVATDVGGVSDVVKDSAGLLVRRGDDQAFAQALLSLVTEPIIRASMGERAKEHVVKRYSGERLVDDIAVLYDSLLKSGTRGRQLADCNRGRRGRRE